MERILIICNKSWETDAALAAIVNIDVCHPNLGLNSEQPIFNLKKIDLPAKLFHGGKEPRAILYKSKYQFEIWCVETIMTPNPDLNDTYYYSRSIQKAKDFPKILKYSSDPVKMVIAFGTAGIPSTLSKAGDVVLGSNSFVYDAAPTEPTGIKYNRPDFNKLLLSTLPDTFFSQLTQSLHQLKMLQFFETRALTPPLNASGTFQIIANFNLTAVSNVNVKSYTDYANTDKEALAAYSKIPKAPPPYSVETTHGLVRIEGNCTNFMFISAITDRVGFFDTEVTPKVHAQNFSAAFNGGILLSYLVPFIEDYF